MTDDEKLEMYRKSCTFDELAKMHIELEKYLPEPKIETVKDELTLTVKKLSPKAGDIVIIETKEQSSVEQLNDLLDLFKSEDDDDDLDYQVIVLNSGHEIRMMTKEELATLGLQRVDDLNNSVLQELSGIYNDMQIHCDKIKDILFTDNRERLKNG